MPRATTAEAHQRWGLSQTWRATYILRTSIEAPSLLDHKCDFDLPKIAAEAEHEATSVAVATLSIVVSLSTLVASATLWIIQR